MVRVSLKLVLPVILWSSLQRPQFATHVTCNRMTYTAVAVLVLGSLGC